MPNLHGWSINNHVPHKCTTWTVQSWPPFWQITPYLKKKFQCKLWALSYKASPRFLWLASSKTLSTCKLLCSQPWKQNKLGKALLCVWQGPNPHKRRLGLEIDWQAKHEGSSFFFIKGTREFNQVTGQKEFHWGMEQILNVCWTD